MLTLREVIESLQELDQDMFIESFEMIDADRHEYIYDDTLLEPEYIEE